jgi:transcriptional regulator GlxA family with amidase domain
MPSNTVRAPAIHCEHCKAAIETAIAQLPGVLAVQVDVSTQHVAVMWDESQQWEPIAARLAGLGYPAEPLNEIKRHVAIVLYDGFTALDAVGPYEVLVSLPDTQVHFVSDQRGPVLADTGQLALVATATWEELPDPQIILIPGGGAGLMRAIENQRLLAWLRQAHAGAEWTTSVCTGVFVLGVAGLLRGLDVTTHWGSREHIAQYCGATYRAERFVRQGKIVTAAGVSAGIDMALFLASQLGGAEVAQAIQLACEYDPAPPFAAGSFAQATPDLVAEANKVIMEYRLSRA